MNRIAIGWWIGCLLSLLLIVPVEAGRWSESASAVSWLFDMVIDTTPFAVLFLLLPVAWFLRRDPLGDLPAGMAAGLDRFRNWCGSGVTDRARIRWAILLIASVSLGMCVRVAAVSVTPEGTAFGDLPPAFHDEFSYRFQARTFAAGRWSWPSHPTVARVFDQMHVWNEGRTASRYFPGTGLWMTPFELAGQPVAGHWTATVLACVLVFAIGRELSCNGVGLLAGLLAAMSPGLALFGNLLLSHQPTLAALCFFIWNALRLLRHLDSDEVVKRTVFTTALASGAGLSFAMLCRPMTAAGVGLPFGIALAVWLVRTGRHHHSAALRVITGYGSALLAGFVVLLIHNAQITGSAWKSPYQEYTNLLTPSHMYGFNNRERAVPLQNPRVLKNYDDWAENLDTALAMRNVRERLLASSQWSLGLVALIVSASVLLIGMTRSRSSRWWLIMAAIVSLHVVHIPYWYVGIMHWHYVFESCVLLCLVAAGATALLLRWFRHAGRPCLATWWSAVLVLSVWVNQSAIIPFWNLSRVEAGISELAYPRLKHDAFQHSVIDRLRGHGPAIVLVHHDPADRHIDYVDNDPALTDEILIGRISSPDDTAVAAAVQAAFPGQTLFVFDVPTGKLARIQINR